MLASYPEWTFNRRLPIGAMLGVFGVAVVFHLGVVLLVHSGAGDQAQFPDARGYGMKSSAIAELWRNGVWLGPSDLAALSGSALWAYPTIMAFCKVVTGGGWLEAKMLLAVLAATGAPSALGLAVASGRSRKRAVAVGLVVGTSPSLLLWDGWGLKEGLIVGLVLGILLLQTLLRFPLACLATLLGVQTCLYLRPPVALFLGVALLARVRFKPDHLVGLLGLAAAAAVVVLPRGMELFDQVGSLEIKEGTSLAFTAGYGSTSLLSHPEYLGVFLFDPFPWAFGPGTAVPGRWLYLGTAIWIASLALVPATLRRAWADTTGVGRPIILASAAYAATYFITFGAAFYRQRSLLECMVMVLVLLYLPLSPGAAASRVYVWLGVVGGLAVLQSPDLAPTKQTKAFALTAMLLVAAAFLAPNPLRRLAHSDHVLKERRCLTVGRKSVPDSGSPSARTGSPSSDSLTTSGSQSRSVR
jgi:hypothetical protein